MEERVSQRLKHQATLRKKDEKAEVKDEEEEEWEEEEEFEEEDEEVLPPLQPQHQPTQVRPPQQRNALGRGQVQQRREARMNAAAPVPL